MPEPKTDIEKPSKEAEASDKAGTNAQAQAVKDLEKAGDQNKLRDLPRAQGLKYTGNLYTNLSIGGKTGEVRKMLSGKPGGEFAKPDLSPDSPRKLSERKDKDAQAGETAQESGSQISGGENAAGFKIDRSNGKVTEISYGNGQDFASISYDEKGEPKSINGPIEILQKQADGSWLSTNTEPANKYEKVTVDENGVITMYEKGKKPYSIDPNSDFTNADKTKQDDAVKKDAQSASDSQGAKDTADGVIIERDQGRVTSISYGNEKDAAYIQYDKQGQPESINGPIEILKRQADGKWISTNTDPPNHYDNVTVDQNGVITMYESGKKPYSIDPRTDFGKEPEHQEYGDGRSRDISRDQETGEPLKIRYTDAEHNYKDTWTRAPGTDEWHQYDSSGKETGRTFKGDVNVGADGSLSYKAEGEEKATVETSDGQYTENADKSRVREENGKPTEVIYPNGNKAEIKNDSNGDPSEIKLSDGLHLLKKDNEWISVDDKGEPVPSGAFKDVVVSSDGTIKVSDQLNNTLEYKTNGGQTEVHNDGSKLEVDAQGRPVSVTLASPKIGTASFGYDEKGEISTIDYGNGNKWTHQDGDLWKRVDSDETWHGAVKVQSDGTYSYRASGDTEVHTQYPDGSRVVVDANGYRLQTRDGTVISSSGSDYINNIDYPAANVHRNFEYDKDGSISSATYQNDITGYKDTWKKQGENDWAQYDADGKPTGMTWQGEIAIDQSTGEYFYQAQGSNEYTVERPDGSVLKADGSNVSEIRRANGEVVNVDKYSNGQVTEYSDSSGTWKSADGIHWANQGGETKVETVTVDAAGTVSFNDGKETRSVYSNGSEVLIDNASGGKRFYDAQGHLNETIDPNNNVYKFTYTQDGSNQLASVSEPDGRTWTSADGQTWTSTDGKQEKKGTYSVNERDGSLTFKDAEKKTEETVRPDGSKTVKDEDPASATYGQVKTSDAKGSEHIDTPAVDRNELEKSAKAFHDAIGYFDATTDTKLMETELQGKSEAEISLMDEYYKKEYGVSLKDAIDSSTSGHETVKLENLLSHRDGVDDNAGFMEEKLAELAEKKISDISGKEAIATEIRQKIASMNSEQIAQMNSDYVKEHPDQKSAIDAIDSNPDIPQSTKDAISIYAKGTDKLTQKDYQSIADQAMANGDLQQFKESMAHMSAEARHDFLDHGGEAKIAEAFSHWYDSDDYTAAVDYAKSGRESLAHKVATETGRFNDNESGIEAAINGMSEADHKAFAEGRKLFAENGANADTGSFTPEQKDAYQYYKDAHEAFSAAGNTEEVLKWEDKAISGGEGSLISQAEKHAGAIYDDKMGPIIADVENMGEKDWNEYKNNPDFRDRLQAMYSTYLDSDELARVQEVLDKKAQAETYEASMEGKRPLSEAVNDAIDSGDNKAFLERLASMTPEEKTDYQSNKDGIKTLVDAYAAQQGMSETVDYLNGKIERGETTSKDDIVVKAAIHSANETDADEAQVASEVLEAFKKDPTLRDRINNPQTDSDREMAAHFKSALSEAVGSSDYDSYIKPILDTGNLSADAVSKLYQGSFDDNEIGFYNSLASLPPDERQKMQASPDSYMSFLNKEEKAVAENILAQDGKMEPADKIRAYQLGAGTMEQEIKDMLKDMSPAEIEAMKRDYASKYGSDLSADIMSEMSGRDERDSSKLLARPQSDGEAFSAALDQATTSRSGSAAEYSDFFNGTGQSVDDAAIQFGKTVAEYSKNFQEMPPEIQQQLAETMKVAIDAHSESKEAMADAMVNGIVTAAALAGALPTGGVSLAGLGALAAGGGALKVAIKSQMLGESYDFETQAATDFISGAVDAATAAAMGGEGLASLGESAAAKTAETMAESAATLLKPGAEAVFETELKAVAKMSIDKGAKEISAEALESMAKAYAKPGMEKEFQEQLKSTLEKEILDETKERAKEVAKAFVKEVGEGALSGTAGGAAQGAMAADYDKGLAQNLEDIAKSAAMSAVSGAVATVAMKGLFSAGGALYKGLKGKAIEPEIDSPGGSGGDGGGGGDGGSGGGGDGHNGGPTVPEIEVPDFSENAATIPEMTAPDLDENVTTKVKIEPEVPLPKPVRPDAPEESVPFNPQDYVPGPGERYFTDPDVKIVEVAKPADTEYEMEAMLKTDPDIRVPNADGDTRIDIPVLGPEAGFKKPELGAQEGKIKKILDEAPTTEMPVVHDGVVTPTGPSKPQRLDGYNTPVEPLPPGQTIPDFLAATLNNADAVLRPEPGGPKGETMVDVENSHQFDDEPTLDQNDDPTGIFQRPQSGAKEGDTNVAIPVSKKPIDAAAIEPVVKNEPIGETDTKPNQQVIKDKLGRPVNRDAETQPELPALKKPPGTGENADAQFEALKKFREEPTAKIETPESRLKKIQEAETLILKRPAELDAMWADTISGQLPDIVKAIQEAKTLIIQRPEGAFNLADAEVTVQIKLPEAKSPNRPPLDADLAGKIDAAKNDPLPFADINAEMKTKGSDYVGMGAAELDVQVNGVDASLVKPGGGFYYDHDPVPKTAAVENKVHIEAANKEELAKMQAVLIPALKTDKALNDLIDNWKTIDPRYGVDDAVWTTPDGKAPSSQVAPGDRGQDAKAFTIYPKDARAAEAIAKRIDEILAQYPEFQNKDVIPTGNADTLVGSTNRVGVVKDYIAKAPESTMDNPQGLIDKEISESIKGDKALQDRADANGVSELTQLENELGLQPGILHEDKQGNLVIDLPWDNSYKKYDSIYMDESEAGKSFGQINSRPALYEIYKKYGYDPKDF